MYQERIGDLGESKLTARRAVGAVLDINPATLHNWVEREEIDTGVRPGVNTEASDELKALRREVAELRRANEILKTASAFFAQAELDRRLQVAVDYIDAHKGRFGVEPICRVLTEHGPKIPPSTYYKRVTCPLSAAELADAYAANTLVDLPSRRGLYGVRKLGHATRRAGHPWGRDQVGRLMGLAGIDGVRRGRRTTITTRRDSSARRHPDRVDRAWATPTRPDQWSVADFTYVWTLAGSVYVSFVTDVYSRRNLGRRVSTAKTTPQVMSALEQALFTRRRRGDAAFTATGLIHHSDAGSVQVAGVHRGAERGRHRRLDRLGR